MAKISKQNFINTVFLSEIKKAIFAVVTFLISVAAVIYCASQNLFPLAGAVVVIAFILIKRELSQISILHAGAKGESEALTLLRELPKSYRVLPDCTISYKGHKSQVDYIIIASTGILLLENKNVSGTISGYITDKNLHQRKYRDGVMYEEKIMYNPFLQVRGHAVTLENILQANKINAPIYTAVYFSNINVRLKMDTKGENAITIHDEEPLGKQVQRILDRGNGSLSPKKLAKIILKGC